jgi:hypothetical protein
MVTFLVAANRIPEKRKNSFKEITTNLLKKSGGFLFYLLPSSIVFLKYANGKALQDIFTAPFGTN